jgi:hypothetical protein
MNSQRTRSARQSLRFIVGELGDIPRRKPYDITKALRVSLEIDGDSERLKDRKSISNSSSIHFLLLSAQIEANLIVTHREN